MLANNDLALRWQVALGFLAVLPITTNMAPLAASLVYSIDSAARIVSVQAAGHLTFSAIEGYAISLRADRRFSPTFSEIVDLRTVDSVSLSAREVMTLADGVDPFSHSSKRAFVVRSQDQVNAAHLHRILRPQTKTICVFYSIDEAREWISGTSGSGGCTVRQRLSLSGLP